MSPLQNTMSAIIIRGLDSFANANPENHVAAPGLIP